MVTIDSIRRLAVGLLCAFAAQAALAAPLIISEFRLRGPNGANDEFIEIYNNTNSPHTVSSSSGTGYGVAASDGVLRFTIPNATVIPAHGHFLGTNSVGYTYDSYPAGNGTTATGDATYTTDIPDNAGIALFNTNIAANFTLANRMDAVGSTAEANTLYKEGTGYPSITPFSIESSFVRDQCGRGGNTGSPGPCSSGGVVKDTDNNAADFVFVDTNGTSAGAGQRLGAPGPENLSAPINNGSSDLVTPLDTCSIPGAAPNLVRDFTSVPAQNSTFGTVDVRFTYTNNSGAPLTRLRFRIVNITTFPAPSGISDLRPRTSSDVVVTVDRPPCGSGTSNITVFGTTLEADNTAPSTGQPNGGGFDSSMSAPGVTLGTPLANGASLDLHILLGIQQTGLFRLGLVPEGLPQSGIGSGIFEYACDTESTTCSFLAAPTVVSIVRADTNPTNAASVDFTVTFDQPVTGVDAADFVLTTTGLSGTSITGVSGSGTTYTVTVNTGTGDGTVRLDLIDDDTIVGNGPLGGVGAGNGNFTTGEVYDVDHTPPSVDVEQAGGQGDPTTTGPINFTVTFSESVTGFDATDVVIGGTAGATTAVVSGGPAIYNVAIDGMTTPGTVTASVAANAAADGVGNLSLASTSTDNTVTFAPPIPLVTSSNRVDPDPSAAASVDFTVTFNMSVTGVDTTDFALTTTGTIAGASVTGVSGSGSSYTVTVNTGTGSGTIRLDVVDDDSIVSGVAPLGGVGAGNGNFTSGQVYTIDRTAPTVTVEQAVGQADPAHTSPVNFTVTFSKSVTGFTSAGVVLGGTAGATTAVVTGGPAIYSVAVSGMTGNGTVIVTVPAGVAADTLGNTNAASTSVDNTVTFAQAAPVSATPAPTLSLPGLLLLALGFLLAAWSTRRAWRR